MTLPHYPMDHAQGRASKGTKVDSRSRSSVPFRHPSLIHHICFSTAAPCQRHVHRSGANRARNPEQPRSLKKKDRQCAGWRTRCGLHVKRSLCPRSSKSLRYGELAHESRARNERLHYLRTKSSTDRKLDEVPLVGRLRKFPLGLLRRIFARRQRTSGRGGRVESERQPQRRASRSLNDTHGLTTAPPLSSHVLVKWLQRNLLKGIPRM